MSLTTEQAALITDLRNLLDETEAETTKAFEADRDSLTTLRLQCKSGTIRNAINYLRRAFEADRTGEDVFDIQRQFNLHEGHSGNLEDLIRYNLNTADCAVYKGDLQGHQAVLGVLAKHRSNF